MEFFFGVLKILFPFIVALVLGVGAVYLFFYLKERKKDKIWTKDLLKIKKEMEVEKDKKMHEKLMLRESFINSLERLKNYLARIYRQGETTFTVTALDAILMVRLFPFNVRKSKDGTYYIIDENEFVFFLKLIINENYSLMGDEQIIKLRNILTKELMGWSPDGIVIDAKFVFDLIKNDNIPSGDIEDQKFIKLAAALEEKVTFKIAKKNEMEKDKKEEKKIQKPKDYSIIKGKDKDYIIDLNTGIQYEVKKKKKEEKKKESKEEHLAKLVENLTLLVASQPQQIANSIKEVINELHLQNNEINQEKIKEKLEKNVLQKVENVNEQTKETKENIKSLMNEIFGSAPKIVEQKNNNEIVSNFEKNDEEKSKNKDEIKSDLQKENLQENEQKIENEIEVNNNNLNEEKDLLDLLSDENFAKDFGISEIENIEKNTNNQNQNKMKDALYFLLREIECDSYSPAPEIEEKIKENLFKNLKEIYILFQTKKYFIDIKDLLKIILMIENDKNLNEEFLDKEFEKFKNKIKEKQLYEIFSNFIEKFNMFNNVILTNNKILTALNLDRFFILEEIKKNKIKINQLKFNQIKNI